MVTPMDRPSPRKHHQDFKYAIISRALHRPKELVASCTVEGLTATWNAISAALSSEERISPEGLGVKILGNAEGPVFMITLPPPERPNEAYYLCMMPAGSQVEGKRLFPSREAEGTSCRSALRGHAKSSRTARRFGSGECKEAHQRRTSCDQCGRVKTTR